MIYSHRIQEYLCKQNTIFKFSKNCFLINKKMLCFYFISKEIFFKKKTFNFLEFLKFIFNNLNYPHFLYFVFDHLFNNRYQYHNLIYICYLQHLNY